MDATTATVQNLRGQRDGLRMARAPYKQIVALSDRIARLERMGLTSEAPQLSARELAARCCKAADITRTCTCSFVVRCMVHGDKHVGTHD